MTARILVVEDEKLVAKDIAKLLKKLGYFVIGTINSGEEAIKKVAELLPDLVMMDIMLKGEMDGIEAAENIKSHFDIPIIFLTAYADENTLQRAKITEPFGYILKPFDERELHTTIEIALRRHLAEAAVRIALEKEKQLSEIKSRFWYMVAHEIRKPLTTILGSAQLLESHSHQMSELKRREYFYLIETSVQSMNELLNNVLTFGRVEGGKLEFKPAPLDLVKFCQELLEELQFQAGSKHRIIFRYQGQSHEGCLDKKLLRPVLRNLLENAIKYSPQGGNIYLELNCQPEEAIFQVKDCGIGIPPEEQKQLFESFHRGANVGNIPGHGLGLTMVKKCLELHHGEIAVDSAIGVGTTFTVTLPMHSCMATCKHVSSQAVDY